MVSTQLVDVTVGFGADAGVNGEAASASISSRGLSTQQGEDVKIDWSCSEDESEMLVRTNEDDCAAALFSGRWEQSALMLQLNSRIIKQETDIKQELGYMVLATPTASMQAGPAEHRQEPARDAEKVPAAQKSKPKNKALARCLVMEVKPRIRRRKFGEGSKHSLGGRPLHVVNKGYLTPIAVTPDSLRACFGKPLHEAAKTLGICETAVKRICRKMGIKEWPFQRIKNIQKRLAKFQSSTATPDVLREILELQGQISSTATFLTRNNFFEPSQTITSE